MLKNLDEIFALIMINFNFIKFDNFEALLVVMSIILLIFKILHLIRKRKVAEEDGILRIFGLGQSFFYIVFFVLILRSTFYEMYNVNTSDFDTEVKPDSKVIVDKIKWGIRLPLLNRLITYKEPERNEIVMVDYKYQNGDDIYSMNYISRIIALPGETITVYPDLYSYTVTTTSGSEFTKKLKKYGSTSKDIIVIKIPEDSIFLMGDSFDLESFESSLAIPIDSIRGSLLYNF